MDLWRYKISFVYSLNAKILQYTIGLQRGNRQSQYIYISQPIALPGIDQIVPKSYLTRDQLGKSSYGSYKNFMVSGLWTKPNFLGGYGISKKSKLMFLFYEATSILVSSICAFASIVNLLIWFYSLCLRKSCKYVLFFAGVLLYRMIRLDCWFVGHLSICCAIVLLAGII